MNYIFTGADPRNLFLSLILLFLGCGCLIFYGFFLKPAASQANESTAVLRSSIESYNQASALSARQKSLLGYQQLIEDFHANLIVEFRNTEFTNYLNRLSKQYSVDVIDESYGVETKNGQHEIRITLLGSYEGVRALMNQFSNFSGFPYIKKADIRKHTDDEVIARLQLAVLAEI